MQAPVLSKSLWKPMFATRNASQKRRRTATQLMKATLREKESATPHTKVAKRLTMTGTENFHYAIPLYKDITIASTMGIATTLQKSVGSPSTSTKDAHYMKGRTDL
eukprot:12041375-Ditylum_brightwellii.AAC.2